MAGPRQAQHSPPLLLWLLLLGGLAAEGRRLGDCYADIGSSMPYAASPGCWSTTGSTGAIIHGRRGGRAIKSRQDGTRSRVLETTHEWKGSMGRVKCSRRGGTTTTAMACVWAARPVCISFCEPGKQGGTKAGRKTPSLSRMPDRIQNQHPLCPDARLASLDPSWQSETPTGYARRGRREGESSSQAGSGRERGVA